MAGNKSNVVGSDRGIIETDQGIVEFSRGGVDNSIFGAINNQREIKQFTSQMQKTVNDSVNSIKDLMKYSNDIVDNVKKLEDTANQTAVRNSALYKNILRDQQSLVALQERAQEASEDQTINAKELVQLYKDIILKMNALNDESGALENIMSTTAKNTKDLKDNLLKAQQAIKDTKAVDTQAIDRAIAKYDKLLEKTKTVGEAVSSGLSTIGNSISTIMNTFNIEKLASGIGRSAKVQLQAQLQQAYNLSDSQFNAFKSNVYGSVNNSLYSSQQIQDAMGSLNEIGVALKDVPKYFDTILKGQVALGMTASTQTALMELSNKTGRAELTLGTTTFAKYLKSIDNLSRSQLNELVTMNAHYESEAADLGVSSDAFSNANMALSGALAKATGNTALAGLMQQVSSSIMNSTDLAAEMIGMSSGEFKSRLNSGATLFDQLQTGQGRLGYYYRNLLENYDYTVAHQDEMTSGMDSSSVKLVNQLVTLQRDNKLTYKMIQDFKGMTGAELQEMIDKYEDSLTPAEKAYNAMTNFIDKNSDWKIQQDILTTLTFIANVLVALGGLSTARNAIGDVAKLFGNGGTLMAGNKLLAKAGGVGAKLANFEVGNAVGLQALGGIASIGTGLVMGGVDAVKMQGSTGKGWLADGARGFFMGTGSKEQSSSENATSILGNAGKYAAIGAGIGTFIGPGVGTVVGGVIGAGIGALTGWLGTRMDDQRKTQEAQLDKQKEIANNTYATATSLSTNANSRSMVSVIPLHSGGDYGAMGGDYDDAKNNQVTFTHGVKHPVQGHNITSWYGWRGNVYNNGVLVSKAGVHGGIDLGAREGTRVGAPYDGKIIFNDLNGSAGNMLTIQDKNGLYHTYMHLREKSFKSVGDEVKAGELVGYVGGTGSGGKKVYASHLHYSVSAGGSGYAKANTFDPYNYLLSASIFNPTGVDVYNGIPTSSNDATGVSDGGSLDRTSQLISMNAIGGDSDNPVVNSINDLKQTIIDLSNRTSQNERLMKSITGSYIRDPRTA